METKPITYAELKQAVLAVQAFVNEKTGNQIPFFRQGLEDGLRIAGDDTSDLLEDFVSRFCVKYGQFDWSFYEWTSEGMFPFEPYTLKWWICGFVMPFWFPFAVIRLLIGLILQVVSKRTGYDLFHYVQGWKRQRVSPKPTVFTGKDLITSYLEKRMCTRKEVRYELIRTP